MTAAAASRWPAGWTGCGPRLAEAGVDALLVTNLANVRYLTGFTGSAGVLAGDRATTPCSPPTAATGPRRPSSWPPPGWPRASRSPSVGVQAQREAVAGLVAGAAARVGPRGRRRHLGRPASLGRRCWPAVELVPTAGLVEALREVKDAGEVARMARAAAIADAALAEVLRPAGLEAADRGGVRPGPRHRHAPAAAPRAAPSRPSWPPGPTRPSPTTARPTGPSAPATRWWSTSGPPSTATART